MTDAPQTPPQGPGEPTGPYQAQPGPYQGGAGVPPVQPPAAPKRGAVGRIVSIIVVVVLLGGAGFYFWNQYKQDQLLQVGKCLTTSGKSTDIQIHEADCNNPDVASWKIGAVTEGSATCADEPVEYASYIYTTGKSGGQYCLQPNMAADRCYTEDTENDLGVVDCAADNATIKVNSVHEGTDTTVCEADEVPLAFGGTNVTYCVVQPS